MAATDILGEYLARMLLDNNDKSANRANNLSTRLSQGRLLKLAASNPEGALENLLRYSDNVADFRELVARVKRIHAARFQAIINKITYQICRVHDYYVICSGWIVDVKMALAGAIDASNKTTVRRLLHEYPEYASMAIERAFRMLELDIGEIACKFDETFATGFEIERGVCEHITQLQTRGIEPLWNELSHLHTAPLRAGCLPIRYAALLNNSRAINTLISHEINTRGSEMRDINMDLVNTAIAACALFNSVETLWLLITYYYSTTLDDLSARSGDALYRVMDAKPNHYVATRELSNKYAHISVASMPPLKFAAKLLVDVAIAGNYESWLVLFCYLMDDKTATTFAEIIAPVVPHMSQKMIRAIAELIPRAQLMGLDKPVKLALFRQCLRCNVLTVAACLLEWDDEMLKIAAYYNHDVIRDLIMLYTTDGSLSKSESSASGGSIEYTQMAKLCLSERVRGRDQIDATLALACYIVKGNTKCAKLLLVNNYCFYVNKFDARLKSAVDEYGDEEIRSLMAAK